MIYSRESAPEPVDQVIRNEVSTVEKETTSQTSPGMQEFERYEIFHRPALGEERMDDLIS